MSVNLIQKRLDSAAAALVEFHDHAATLVAANYSKEKVHIFALNCILSPQRHGGVVTAR